MKIRKRRENFVCIAALLIFAVFMIYEAVAGRLFKIPEGVYYYVAALLSAGMLVGGAVLIARAFGAKPREFLRLKPFRLKWAPVTIFAAVTAMLGAALINLALLNIGLPDWMQPQVTQPFFTGMADPVAPFLALILVPAIFEELFIHGAALSAFGAGHGDFRAVLVSALIFAMMHGTAADLPGTFFAALVYGYLTLICGSVYPAMLAHLLNNLLSGTVLMYGQNFFNIGYNKYFIFAAAVLFLLFAFLFLVCLERFYKRKPAPEPAKRHTAYLPLGLIPFAVLWVAKTILSIYNII